MAAAVIRQPVQAKAADQRKHDQRRHRTHGLQGQADRPRLPPHDQHGAKRTRLNSDWIERQLAHGNENEVRGIYNKATYLDQRSRDMMQTWADQLDSMVKGWGTW